MIIAVGWSWFTRSSPQQYNPRQLQAKQTVFVCEGEQKPGWHGKLCCGLFLIVCQSQTKDQ